MAAQARAERASGYALYAGDGGPEAELAIYAAAAFYLIAKPGVVPWAFDQTVANAVGRALERKFDAASVRRGRRLGAGSFGTVFEAEDLKSGRTVVVKQSNAVEGASELQNAEAYINRRVARAPLVAAGCAKFLGTYYEVEGARSPCLVWAREEGDATLEDFLEDRGFPDALEDALGIRARDGDDEAKRANRCAKKIMRDLLGTVAALHDIGIVHRDLKPSNLVLMGKRFKLIDFGAACDLRSGENYDPEQGLLDPKYSPPEQFIMSEKTPAPPPLVAGVLAPASVDHRAAATVRLVLRGFDSPSARRPAASREERHGSERRLSEASRRRRLRFTQVARRRRVARSPGTFPPSTSTAASRGTWRAGSSPSATSLRRGRLDVRRRARAPVPARLARLARPPCDSRNSHDSTTTTTTATSPRASRVASCDEHNAGAARARDHRRQGRPRRRQKRRVG